MKRDAQRQQPLPRRGQDQGQRPTGNRISAKTIGGTTPATSPKSVADIAKKVIVITAEKSVPLTPENYHVWFEYFLGTNQELTAAIDELIAANVRFSQEINERLYDTYLNRNKHELLQEVQRETQKIFTNIFRATLSTNDLASDYSDKLGKYSTALTDANDLTQIQNVIEELIQDTNQMAEVSRHLNQQLEEATSQIQTLSKQLEETKREVLLDALTGLSNRKAFDKKIDELCDKFNKTDGFFSVIMLDIDFFKKVNDLHGHQIGDEVLRIVGSQLKENLKGKDFPARYGGEEFIVLLPNTKMDKARMVAEQIRENISQKRLKIKKTGQPIGNVTVSVGVSEIRAGDTATSVVERADAALYVAKNSGRNNVKTENELQSVADGA